MLQNRRHQQKTSFIYSLLVFIIFISVHRASYTLIPPMKNSHDLLNAFTDLRCAGQIIKCRGGLSQSDISSFLRSFKLAPFLPDDYRRVTKSMDLGNEDRPGKPYTIE
ncbi:hypothetical protein TYRP_023307 [Tyrophagus putrescentiae]|nr:hypothetical protein TYRP_023307 [Tyrophagus putrescentiae]